MKVGFDIHGVIDDNPNLFSKIINELSEKGFEIHILTGSLIYGDLIKELDSCKIKYDYLFSILEYHKKNGTEMWKDNRGWWIDDDLWNKTKSEYCHKHDINLHIDDSKVYRKYFKTSFGHISLSQDIPRILEIKGDVDFKVLEVLKNNEGYYKMKFI